MPEHVFMVSNIPRVSFTGFDLNLPKRVSYLLPIFNTGEYFEQKDRK